MTFTVKIYDEYEYECIALLLLLCIYTQGNISIYYRTQSAIYQSDCTGTAPTHK